MPPHDKVVLALAVEKIIRVIKTEGKVLYGRCIACEEEGVLEYRYGTYWRPRFRTDKILIHRHYCPVNKVLVNQKQK